MMGGAFVAFGGGEAGYFAQRGEASAGEKRSMTFYFS